MRGLRKLSLFTGLVTSFLALESCNTKEIITNTENKESTTDIISSESETTSETYTSDTFTESSSVSSNIDYTSTSHTNLENEIVENVIYDEFQIHFLELGNQFAGDSIYIKAGDNDILIDAGSRANSVSTLKSQINEYCLDNKLEYVISTHGDQDHISGFVGSKSGSTYDGIMYSYDIDNIIYNHLTSKKTTLYSNFIKAVEYAEINGSNIMFADEFFEEDMLTSTKAATIRLSENVTMTIIWNYYYFNNSSDENEYSVCTLFTYDDGEYEHNFLLTGDLEEKGEEKIASYYSSGLYGTLPHCDLFKAGHHGSATSSNLELLNLITPSVCCVCTCAGTNEYTTQYINQFPTQAFINRIAKFTDRVYVTSTIDFNTKKYIPLNGKIIVSCEKNKIGLSATNNLTKLKDSPWFSETIYVKNYKEEANGLNGGDNCAKKGGGNVFYDAETQGVTAVPRRIWPQII